MLGRLTLFAMVALLAFLSGAWAALALYYRLPGNLLLRLLGSILWTALVASLFVLMWHRHSWPPLALYAAIHAVVMLWWISITPSNLRAWRDDVARLLVGQVHDDHAVLDNVRNFRWRSDSDYDIRWEQRTHDLDQLVSADAVLSYWSGPAIAHAMISFGFDDGRHLVFSVEVRKRRDQKYSSIGGFFKQFETILVAADEGDIIRVRTNVRHEDVYLYPLCIERGTMRALFLAYLAAANRLASRPAFYNTFTSNCSTLVHRMARKIDPGLPWDMRLLLTGYLPEYLYEIGMLDQSLPLDELRQRGHVTERAKSIAADTDFSHAIRQANATA
ncbi:MAG TPA: DUF4105 domain-containing protein [Rhodanobacter sp.]|nr:DUF4105 domain-containing protein [Rhodanobacter sp.]